LNCGAGHDMMQRATGGATVVLAGETCSAAAARLRFRAAEDALEVTAA